MLSFAALGIVSSLIAGLLQLISSIKINIFYLLAFVSVASGIITLMRKRILVWVLSLTARLSGIQSDLDDEENELDDFLSSIESLGRLMEAYYGDENISDLFVIWTFISKLRDLVTPGVEPLGIAVVEVPSMVPIAVYPLDSAFFESVDDATLEAMGRKIKRGLYFSAALYSKEYGLQVIMSNNFYRKLLESIKEDPLTNKEKIFVKDKTLMKSIALLAQEIYKAVNPQAPEELVVYTVYKALKKLEEEGLIAYSGEARDAILPEKSDLRIKLLEQIREEESVSNTKNR